MPDDAEQAVLINNRYAYQWVGREPLKIGDRVLLPGGYGMEPWVGRVTGFGRNGYAGPLTSILNRVAS